MELPDFGLVVWGLLVLDYVFVFSYKYLHASLCTIGG